ncbi:MAG TPA: oligosaccharide flippase family protein [Anaerolineales bacterium]
MSLIQKAKSYLQNNPIIRRVLRNSGYLFSGNAISAALGLVQNIFMVRLLGIEQYGLAIGIMLFATNVNRFLSFRMSEVVTKYMGEALAQGNKDRAAALAKWVGLSEAIASVLAFLVLFILAPWYAKDPTITTLYQFYGLYLLFNLIYETSTGVLQATDKFNRVAFANLLQGVVTIIIVAIAYIMKWGIFEILAAYLIGKLIAAWIVTSSAIQQLTRRVGKNWLRAPASLISDWKSIGKFAFSTNINGTVNLFARDNIPLYIQSLLGPVAGNIALGYYNIAAKFIMLVTLPIDPFIGPTYAEITRTIAQKQWNTTRKLLRQVTLVGGVWTLIAGGGLVVLGWWFIPLLYGTEAAPSYIFLVILLLGYGYSNVFNWNRPFLLALGYPNYPLMVAAITGAVEIALIFLFGPGGNYLTIVSIFSMYLIVSVCWNILRGFFIIKREETIA